MGFLTMAYGKLAAGKNYRQIQSRLVQVQRELHRVTKQVGDQQKALERQKRDAITALTTGIQVGQNTLIGALGFTGITGTAADLLGVMGLSAEEQTAFLNRQIKTNQDGVNVPGITSERYAAIQQQLFEKQSSYTTTNSMIQQASSFLKTMAEDYYDNIADQQLQPLKDLEEELTLEKENLESQKELAKQDYDAFREGEKSDAQYMKPSYTGGGG